MLYQHSQCPGWAACSLLPAGKRTLINAEKLGRTFAGQTKSPPFGDQLLAERLGRREGVISEKVDNPGQVFRLRLLLSILPVKDGAGGDRKSTRLNSSH